MENNITVLPLLYPIDLDLVSIRIAYYPIKTLFHRDTIEIVLNSKAMDADRMSYGDTLNKKSLSFCNERLQVGNEGFEPPTPSV